MRISALNSRGSQWERDDIVDAAQARQILQATRYRNGSRGFSNSPRTGTYCRANLAEHMAAEDGRHAIIAQIEDRAALDNLLAIASVEQIDCMLVGRADLAVSLGVSVLDDPRVESAVTGQSEDVVGLAQAARRGGADSVVMMGRFMGFLPDLETGLPLLGTSATIGGSWALPLTERWLMMTRKAMGDDYPLIATNGARNGLDVGRFLLAAACATEMTSAVFTDGYEVLTRAVRELDEYVVKRGLSVEQLLGSAPDQVQTYQQQPDRPEWLKGFAPECPEYPG